MELKPSHWNGADEIMVGVKNKKMKIKIESFFLKTVEHLKNDGIYKNVQAWQIRIFLRGF